MSTQIKKQRCGDTQLIKRVLCWHECELCERPAKYQITYLLSGARSDPRSSAYGRDDCSYCSDARAYACEAHKDEVRRNPPEGHRWCAMFPLKSRLHIGFYWKTVGTTEGATK